MREEWEANARRLAYAIRAKQQTFEDFYNHKYSWNPFKRKEFHDLLDRGRAADRELEDALKAHDELVKINAPQP